MARQSRPLPPVLLTRPRAQAERFAEGLRARFGAGIRVVIAPLLSPRYLTPLLPEALAGARGMIFTSETGVEGFARISAVGPPLAWCVGPSTAAAARAAGYEAIAAGGDAESLLALLLARRAAGPLVHARGIHARGELAERLNSAGTETVEVMVYEQIPRPLTAEAETILAGTEPVLAPLFSPRSAGLFARAAGQAPLWIAAISPAAAAEVAALGPARIEIAPEPSAEGMMAAVSALIAAPGSA